MPIVIGIFGLIPLGLGLLLEYLCFRIPKRKLWRALPPVLGALFVLAAATGRMSLWESQRVSPITQLMIFPGVPGVCFFAGCWLGWRAWKRLWGPRVIDP